MIVYEKFIDSTFQAANDAAIEIIEILKNRWPCLDSKMIFRINFVLRETLNNAVEHGNQFNKEKQVLCKVIKEPEHLILEIKDEGNGITIKDEFFDEEDNETLLRERKRGYQIINEMAFQVSIIGNCVKIILDLKQEECDNGK